jgi:hypothetical protein
MATVWVRHMAGQCRNGAERDRGKLYHAVVADRDPATTSQRALCGKTPGRRSNGWSEWSAPSVTCERCRVKWIEMMRTKGVVLRGGEPKPSVSP